VADAVKDVVRGDEWHAQRLEVPRRLSCKKVLIFCLGKMRVCRPKAAKCRRRTGLGVFSVNPGPSSSKRHLSQGCSLCLSCKKLT